MLGWGAHYAIGLTFAAVLVLGAGLEWARAPSLGPALLVGILTVGAPYLILQPALGAGIAASKLPNPNLARVQSLLTHTVYGLGLFGSAKLLSHLLQG